MGQLFSMKVVVKLYDAQGEEIGMTIGGSKEIAYAMSQSKRIEKAVAYSELFGTEEIRRSDITPEAMKKVENKHQLGNNLLFWVGKPLVINK